MYRYNADDWTRRYGLEPSLFDLDLPPARHGGPWVAGGAIRRTLEGKPLNSDIDFFFSDEVQLNQFSKWLGKPDSQTDHVLTWKRAPHVQAIKIRFYETVEAVIDSFDFSICQAAYDGTDFILGEHTLWDLAQRKLVPHKVTYAASTMRRAIKYAGQGFTLCPGTATEIYRQVIENPDSVDLTLEYVD